MSRKLKTALAKNIIRVTDENIDDEELIHALLEEEIYVSSEEEQLSFGDKAADFLAKFAGSWLFIISFCIFLTGWIVLNLYFLSTPFDPYPFILLNLILSCLASVQAPLIMMSQNRQEEKDRRRAESDYKVSLKSEIIIEDIHHKLDKILAQQKLLLSGYADGENTHNSENTVTEVEKES
ncbi:MAG: DUF1003 domain-containing protein [Oscillospiraceae bacterium]|nr:DUF1003 domain-containing protein [Oscillospiraceae bacterium]